MATYGGYKIIVSSRDGRWQDLAAEVEQAVNDLMLEGWEPYFGLLVMDNRLAQVMLWNGEDDDGNPTRPPA